MVYSDYDTNNEILSSTKKIFTPIIFYASMH